MQPSNDFINKLPDAIRYCPRENHDEQAVEEEPSFDSEGNMWVKIGDYNVNINTVTKQ